MNTIINILLAIGTLLVATGITGFIIAVFRMPTQDNQK